MFISTGISTRVTVHNIVSSMQFISSCRTQQSFQVINGHSIYVLRWIACTYILQQTFNTDALKFYWIQLQPDDFIKNYIYVSSSHMIWVNQWHRKG